MQCAHSQCTKLGRYACYFILCMKIFFFFKVIEPFWFDRHWPAQWGCGLHCLPWHVFFKQLGKQDSSLWNFLWACGFVFSTEVYIQRIFWEFLAIIWNDFNNLNKLFFSICSNNYVSFWLICEGPVYLWFCWTTSLIMWSESLTCVSILLQVETH